MNRLIALLIVVLCSGVWAYAQRSAEADYTDKPARKLEKVNINLETQIHLFPNPTKEYLNIEISHPELMDLKFTMYDIIGNVIEIKLEQLLQNKFRIPVSTYVPGYYILIIKDNKTDLSQAFRFSKE